MDNSSLPLTPGAPSPFADLDWGNDEAVVREAIEEGCMERTFGSRPIRYFIASGPVFPSENKNTPEEAWAAAREHFRVVSFERAHNPAYAKPAPSPVIVPTAPPASIDPSDSPMRKCLLLDPTLYLKVENTQVAIFKPNYGTITDFFVTEKYAWEVAWKFMNPNRTAAEVIRPKPTPLTSRSAYRQSEADAFMDHQAALLAQKDAKILDLTIRGHEGDQQFVALKDELKAEKELREKAESQRDALMREINKKLLPELSTLRKRVEELEKASTLHLAIIDSRTSMVQRTVQRAEAAESSLADLQVDSQCSTCRHPWYCHWRNTTNGQSGCFGANVVVSFNAPPQCTCTALPSPPTTEDHADTQST